MISVFENGVLNWAIVGSAVYLVFVLLVADVVWRRTSIGGKVLFGSALLLSLVGIFAIFSFWA